MKRHIMGESTTLKQRTSGHAGATAPILETRALTVRAGGRDLIRNVSLSITPGQAFGIIGPSGAGKSTLLKCLNRLVELTPGLQVSGEILFHQRPIHGPGVDVDA